MAEMFVGSVADAYVQASQPTTNYGSETQLIARQDSTWEIFLDSFVKFNVPDVDITSAELRIFIVPHYPFFPTNIDLFRASSAWEEDTINWNARAALIQEHILTFPTDPGMFETWVKLDVTDYVKANRGQPVSFILGALGDPGWANFASRETANPPNLRIIYTEVVEPTTGGIVGIVTDSVTGLPLSGVDISGEFPTFTTGPDGSYSIQNLAPMNYEVVYEKTGYTAQSIFIDVIAGASAERNIQLVPIVEPPPDRAITHFTSSPSGAEIWDDGDYSGYNTPHTVTKLTRMDSDFTYKLTGYNDESFHATVEAGQELTFHRVLTPITPPPEDYGGVVGIVTDLDTGNAIGDVLVSIDGYQTTTAGNGIYSIQNLLVGDYAMVFSKDGYESEVKYVAILKDVSATVDVQLGPEYPFPITGWLAQAKTFILETLPGWIIAIPRVIADNLDNVFHISTIFNTTIPNAIQTAKNYAKALVDSIQLIIPQWIIDAANWVVSKSAQVWDWINTKSADVWNWISNYSADVWDWIDTKSSTVWNWINTKSSTVWNWINTKSSTVWNWINTKSSAVWNWINTKSSVVWEWIDNRSSAVWDWIENKSSIVWGVITNHVPLMWNWIAGVGTDAVNWVNDAGIELYNDFQDFKAKIIEHVENAIFYILDKSIEKKEDIREEFRKGMP